MAVALLDDAAMQAFIVRGFHKVSPEEMALPTSFHTAIAEKMRQLFDEEETRQRTRDSLNDALLHMLPELRDLFADAATNGALTSILGRDWCLHSHSYAHDRFPTTAKQEEMIHKDGGFIGTYDGLVTRTRWALILYYPQAVASDFGPTEIVPHTHYLFENPLPDPTERGTALTSVVPGTFVVTSFELWHRATHNRATTGLARFVAMQLAEGISRPAAKAHATTRFQESTE